MEAVAESDSIVLTNRTAEINRAADWLRDKGRRLAIADEVAFAMRLCIEEALANVVVHAHAGLDRAPEPRDILVRFEKRGEVVAVAIEDDGRPFDPLSQSPLPRSGFLDEASIGGRGILLMKEYASRVAYDRRDGRNVLVMEFDL